MPEDKWWNHDYCGCCGREIKQPLMPRGYCWCSDCWEHVLKDSRPLWDRSYFAQHGTHCPFEEEL